MTKTDFDMMITEHEMWFSNRSVGKRLDLRGTDLRGHSLAGRHLHECRLTDVDLSEADIRKTAFVRAELTRVQFHNVLGEEARFSNSVLMSCVFQTANLKRTEFDGVRAIDCEFKTVDLSEAVLIKADFTNVLIVESNLHFINGLRLDMKNGSLSRCRLCEVDLQRAMIVGVDMRYSDIDNCALDHTYFKHVRVYGMHGIPAFLDECSAEAIDFSPSGDNSDLRSESEFLAWLTNP